MASDNQNKDGQLPVLQSPGSLSSSRKRKSGRGRIRAAVLIAVHVVIALHITHFMMTRYSVSPVEPSEAMYSLELGYLNAGTIFFGLAILSTLIFGRFFCGWACHLVALQDLCAYLLRRLGIRPKPLRSRLLILMPFAIAFYMFFLPTIQRLFRAEPHPGFTNHLLTDNFWVTFPGPYIATLTFVICGGVIVYLLGNKGFCTYACPYGAFFSVADQAAVGRIRVTDACHECGQCTAACTSNVMVHAEVKEFGMVVDPGCMKCMDCVSVCPNEALYFGFTDKAGVAKQRAENPPSRRRKKTYDFSITEEILALAVALFSIYSLRGLYDIMPLLLSVALGMLTAYFSIKLIRIFRVRDLRVQHFRLKRGGAITGAGWVTFALLFLWIAFIVHSCYVQVHRYRGRESLNRVVISWTNLLEGPDKLQERLTADDHANALAASQGFGRADRVGLMGVLEIKLGLVYTNMMSGNVEAAEKYLREAYECDPVVAGEMLMEFLASQGRAREAEELL